MIKAIIFDCFGVLTTDGWLAFRHKYLQEGSVEDKEASQFNRQTDAGLISHDEFVKRIAELAGVSREEAMMVVDGHVRNDQLFEYIRDELKPHYKIGLLSNASADYTHELFEPWQIELLDAMTFSFELGVVKPDPLMYENIAAKLGASAEECIFIDDREGFVDGAQRVGMRAVWYQSNEQLKRELEALLRP
jgi:putative hydrolase of the HAD superfamily